MNAVPDVQITLDAATAAVTGETEDGEEFVDAWALGVLTVEDYGRITVTAEVLGDLRKAAAARQLSVETESA